MKTRVALRAIFVMAMIAVSPAAFCATVTFTGGGDGSSWSDSANWSTASVPTISDDVIIPTGVGTVFLDVDTTVNSFTVQNLARLWIESGQVLTVNNSSTIDHGASLRLDSGTFSGNGDLTVNGQIDLLGGTLGGGGALTISGPPFNGVLFVQGDNSSVVSRTTTNAGSIDVFDNGGSGSNFIFSGATLTNTGEIDINTDHDIDPGLGSPTLNNNSGGVITKSAGSGTAAINFTVNNAAGATIDVQTGTLALNGGGTVSGGTITGTGALNVSGNFTWSGGTITGSGPRVLTSTSVPTIGSCSVTCLLDGATLQLQASATFNAASSPFVFSNGASLTIDPGKTLSITNAGDFSSGVGGGSIINNGTIWKTSAPNLSTIAVPVTLSGTSTVDIDAGTLQFGGGTSVASGATLNIAGGTTLEVTGGVFLFNSGTVSMPGSGDFKVSAGTLRVPTAITTTIPNMTLQGSGIIDGGGTLILSGPSSWTGGTMGSASAPGGVTQIDSGNTLSILGNSSPQLLTQNRQLLNNGTVSYGGIGANTLTMSGNSKITNNGTLNLTNNSVINNSPAGSALIENNGTFARSNGTATSTIQPRVENNNGATMSVIAGTTVDLFGGGVAAGAYAISSGAVVRLRAGTFTVASTSTVPGAGTLSLFGAGVIVDISSGANVSWPNVDFSGGMITGAGALHMSGIFTWSGGTIGGAGPRVLDSSSTPVVNGFVFLDAAALQIQASATFSGSNVSFTNGASLTIDPGKTLNITNNGGFISGAGGGSIVNNGTIWKTTTAGTSFVGVPVTMAASSTIDLDAGTLQFAGGAGVAAGTTIDIGAGTTLSVTGGVFVFNSGSVSMPGSGTFRVSGVGTLRVPTGINTTVPNVTMTSGVIDGGGTLILSGTSTWAGGTMGSATAPGGITRIDSGATLNIPNAAFPTLTQSRLLQNNGTLNLLAGSQLISGSGSETIQNNGSITGNGSFGNFTFWPRVENNNGATVSVVTGTINLINGGIAAGGYSIAAGATLKLGGGTFTVASTATVTGAGTLSVFGATLDASPGVDLTCPNLNLDFATITGAGAVRVSGTFTWSGGTIAGSGPRVLNSTSTPTFSCSGNCILDGAALQLQASATYSGSSSGLVFSNGASLILDPGKTLNITNSGDFVDGGGAASSIINNGTIWKTSSSGTSNIAVPVTLSGTSTVDIDATLQFSGGVNVAPGATIDIAAGNALEVAGGVFLFNSGSVSMPGNGLFLVSAGALRVPTSITTTIHNLLLLGSGVIDGGGTLILTGGASWLSGSMGSASAPGGITQISSGSTLTISPSAVGLTQGREIQNSGTVNYFGASTLTLSGASKITNNATFNLNADGDINLSGSATIDNNGTLTKIGGTGTSTIFPAVNNAGTVSATTGTLALAGGGTHSGTFTATNAGSVIDFSGGAHTISGPFAGAGKFRFSGGTAAVNNAWSGKLIDVAGGSVAFNTSGTLPALSLSGGTLAGSGDLTIAGPSTWSGGTIGGSGALTFDTGATVSMPGTSATTLSRPLMNRGTINFTAASSAMLIDGVAVTNSGTFDIQSSQSILVTPGTPPFINNGTLRKSSGAGVMQFAAPLANTSLVQVSAGTLNFSGTYTQTAGATDVLPGATLQTAILSLNGGTLKGNGTIAGTVDNHAIVAPGASPGTLTISGDYVQAANGELDIQIGGTAPGTQYDQLLVSGNVTLGGSLNVTPISGFVPAAGNVFQVLTFGARPNYMGFAFINGLEYGFGTALVPTYSAGDLQLITNNIQADLAALVSAPPFVTTGSAFAYTVSIINQGGSDATGVSFSAALPPNVTFNSASPAICSGAPNLICTIGALPNSSAAVVTLGVTANGAGTAPIIVSTTGNEFDPNRADNSTSASPSITDAADLRIAVTGTPSTVSGSRAIYTITVTNNGPNAAGNVAVSVAASPGLSFSANGGACTGSFPCTIGALSSGQSATINSAWDISPSASGSVQLTVNVSSSTPDPTSSNNSASAATQIGTCPAIVINAPRELKSGASAQASATATAALAGGAIYNWSISDGTIDSGDGTDTITFTTGAAGTATLAVNVTGTACTLSTSVLMTVKPKLTCQGTAAPTSPAGGTTTADAVVTFTWTSIEGSSGYRLWLQQGDARAQSLGRTLGTSLTKVIPPGAQHWYVETLFDGCASHQSEHLALTILPAQDCDTHGPPQLTAPAIDAVTTSATVAFSWGAVARAIEYELWLAPAGGVPTLIHITSDTSYTADVPPGGLEWYVRAIFGGCGATESAHQTFSYTPPPQCTAQRPLLIAPVEGERLTSPVSFEWRAVPGAASYELYVDGALAATTTSPHTAGIPLPLDERRWRVRARLAEGCGALDSAESRIVVLAPAPSCTPLQSPLVTAPGQISSGVTARIQWTFVPGATAYVVQISNDPNFSRADTTSSTVAARELPFTFTNDSNVPAPRYVRVYAIDTECVVPGSGPFSPAAVVSVLPRNGTTGVALLSDPADIEYTLNIPADRAGLSFIATTTASWITVTPSSGIVPPGGQTLRAFAHTAGLPPGASTGTVVITTAAAAGTRVALGGPPPTNTSITADVTSGVTTQATSTPPDDALIIPAVANVTNFIVKFQSDVRITNTSAQPITYDINFTPTGPTGISQGQTITQTIESGATLALNDIVSSWFGGPSSTSGTLELRSQTETGSADRITFASSRTFGVSPDGGTFGQYVPAANYENFVSKGSVISLQQIAQSDEFRTNLGLVEGSGAAVTVQVRIFDSAGTRLGEFSQDLAGFQHLQINEVLKAHDIALKDGRIEVEVTEGEGKVTAYASVLGTAGISDPLLVPPVNIGDAGHSKWVVPGVGGPPGDSSTWQTDVHIFNAGEDPAELTLVFYSTNGGTATTKTITLAPGEARQFADMLPTFFAIPQGAGALYVSSAAPARLVVTARTYNETAQGTYGQFIPAATPEEAVTKGSRPLQILQVEESADYQSNIGFAEVSGKAVTLEVSVFESGHATATGLLEVKLAPNEFRQIDSLLSTLDPPLAGIYNARISVRVKDGEGSAIAYLSLVDRKSHDPTYVPGQ